MDDVAASRPEAQAARRRRLFWAGYGAYVVGVVLLLGTIWKVRGTFPPRLEAIAVIWLLPGVLLLMVVALGWGIHDPLPHLLHVLLIALGCLAAPPLAARALRSWRRMPLRERDHRGPLLARVYFAYSLFVAAITVGALVLVAGRGSDAWDDMFGILPQWIAIFPPFSTISVSNARTGFFEAADFQAVCAHLPEALRPVATFMYLTGWRKREVLTLTWDRIDFTVSVIRLEMGTTKNDEGRTFPFAVLPPLEDLLRRQRLATLALERRAGKPIPHVFHRHEKPIRDFRGAWKEACTQAGCPKRIPHDFRRTAVRNLERAGVPRSVAMKLTGHKTEAVYRRYAIVSEADLSEGVAKLAALRPLEVKDPQAGIDTVLAQIGAGGSPEGE